MNTELTKRSHSINGSDANTIMSGNRYEITKLWMQKLGTRPLDDLDDVLAVAMGQCTQELNAHWYEKRTGETVLERGRKVIDGRYDWRTATVHGVIHHNNDFNADPLAVWQAKHIGPYSEMDRVLQSNMALLHHNMDCLNTNMAILSVFRGTYEYQYFTVDYDALYALELRRTEEVFLDCLNTGNHPFALEDGEIE